MKGSWAVILSAHSSLLNKNQFGFLNCIEKKKINRLKQINNMTQKLPGVIFNPFSEKRGDTKGENIFCCLEIYVLKWAK